MRKVLLFVFLLLNCVPLFAADNAAKSTVARYFELRERTLSTGATEADVDQIVALMTGDVQVEHPGAPIVLSRAQVRDGMIAHLAEGGRASFHLRRAHFDGDYGVVEFTLTFDKDGRCQSRAGIATFTFARGKISHLVEYNEAWR